MYLLFSVCNHDCMTDRYRSYAKQLTKIGNLGCFPNQDLFVEPGLFKKVTSRGDLY